MPGDLFNILKKLPTIASDCATAEYSSLPPELVGMAASKLRRITYTDEGLLTLRRFPNVSSFSKAFGPRILAFYVLITHLLHDWAYHEVTQIVCYSKTFHPTNYQPNSL